MRETTKQLVRKWLAQHQGDAESTAQWMSNTLRIGSLRDCRALIELSTKLA